MEVIEAFKFSRSIPNSIYLSVEPYSKNLNKTGIPEPLKFLEGRVKNLKKLLNKGFVEKMGGDISKVPNFGTYGVRLCGLADEMINDPKKGKCSKLTENGCSIHDNKPLICHLVPATMVGSPIIDFHLTKDFINRYECDNDKEQEVIYRGNDFIPYYQKIRKEIIKQRQETIEIAQVYFGNFLMDFFDDRLDNMGHVSKDDLEYLIYDTLNQRIPANSPIVFSGLIQKNLIGEEDIVNWLDSKIDSPKLIMDNMSEIVSGKTYQVACERMSD